MDPRSTKTAAFAPGFGAQSAESPRWPGVDAHVVEPETREEMLRGRRVIAAPSLPEHGDPHLRLDVVVGTNVSPQHVASTDLLTRVADDGDFASATSVRRAGVDPATGQRYLEEMAFEVVNTQRLSDVTAKAEDLTARGVRRVFAVFVRRGMVSEWRDGLWEHLADDGFIEDVCLAAPIPVAALLRASEMGNAVVRGLLARNEPALREVLTEREARGEARGAQRGRREALRVLLAARGLACGADHEARIEACHDEATLDRWIAQAATARTADEALA